MPGKRRNRYDQLNSGERERFIPMVRRCAVKEEEAVNHNFYQMIISFHRVVNEQTGTDVTIARTKTMVALASLTWPETGIVVNYKSGEHGRVFWNSEDFNALSIGGSFRRDPVGDDASLVIDEDESYEMVMLEEMLECASFIPLFGRQKLERFNRTLAGMIDYKEKNVPPPTPGNEDSLVFPYEEEFRKLFGWLAEHERITPEGNWLTGHS